MPIDEEITANENHATAQEIHTYQSKIRSINFAAISTRPDVAFTASKLSSFLQNPSYRHLYLAQRVLAYLGGTKQHSLVFSGYQQSSPQVFTISSDASYGTDPETRRSYQGYLFTLFGGPVDWKAAKQSTVTTSSIEAELLSLSDTAKQALWWDRFFSAIHFSPGHSTSIQYDNRQTIRLLEEKASKLITKLRHVDIHNHWLRQEL